VLFLHVAFCGSGRARRVAVEGDAPVAGDFLEDTIADWLVQSRLLTESGDDVAVQ
jgi:hypothetical protein